jgi:Ran-binding protein 3
MTESTNNSSLDEPNGLPVTVEQNTTTSRQYSPLSGGSDNDGSEKPVREKLKKASIAGLSSHAKANDDKTQSHEVDAESSAEEEEKDQGDNMLTDTTPSFRGRPTRKRSFDDLQNESTTSIDAPALDDSTRAGGHHKRMRSRDMSSTTKTAVNGKVDREQVEALAEEEDDIEAQNSPGGAGVMVEAHTMDDEAGDSGNQSPKKKRSRDQFDKDHDAEGGSEKEEGSTEVVSEREQLKAEEDVTRTTTNSDKGEPEKKRHRDASQEGRNVAEAQPMTTEVCTRASEPGLTMAGTLHTD